MTALLQVEGLGKSFVDGGERIQVLNDLSFNLDRGRSLAVTGPSGSGKSTLLNILAGSIVADQGAVMLHGANVVYALAEMDERARTRLRRESIGYVHQFYNLVPTLTVLENVCLPAYLNKRSELYDQALELLDRFHLKNRMDAFPEVLSGGEQQRVAVARALLMQPPLVLADEPTGNLDAQNAKITADLLFEHAAQLDVSVVIATHSQDVAARASEHLELNAV